MNTNPSRPPPAWAQYGLLLARLLLGGLFLYLGLVKALDPVAFLKLVRQYGVTNQPWALNGIAGGLPWFEVFCGILLVTGIAVRGVAVTVAAVLIPFSLLVWQRAVALQHLRGLPFCAIKFDCGCGNGEVYICGKLAENGGLLLLAFVLAVAGGGAWCLRARLFRPRY